MPAFYIARHGETVFNAVGRMQGIAAHTPVTRAGFAQAEAIGGALLERLGPRPDLRLWASPTGRALQTLAVIAERLGLDWHEARSDARLAEMAMGEWGGRYYRDIEAETGPFVDRASLLFTRRPPGGEWYDEIAARLGAWLDERSCEQGELLVVAHGISSRVLRGLLTGAPASEPWNAPIAPGLPQGSVVRIENGVEELLHRGSGGERPA